MNHKRNKYQKRINIQLTVAVMLCLAGLSLLFMGFWCSPTGEIHNSVLIGFGEVSTFAGALFGVDYNIRRKGTIKKKIEFRNAKQHYYENTGDIICLYTGRSICLL